MSYSANIRPQWCRANGSQLQTQASFRHPLVAVRSLVVRPNI